MSFWHQRRPGFFRRFLTRFISLSLHRPARAAMPLRLPRPERSPVNPLRFVPAPPWATPSVYFLNLEQSAGFLVTVEFLDENLEFIRSGGRRGDAGSRLRFMFGLFRDAGAR